MHWASWNVMTVSLLTLAAMTVPAFNILVDPYGVFGTPWPRDSNAMNERFLKVEHVLKNAGKYNAFLIGSSVMGIYDPKVAERIRPGMRFYNLSFLGGTPGESLAVLRTLNRHGVKVHEVVMGIDVYPFRKRVDTDRHDRRAHPSVTGQNRLSWYASYLFAPSLLPGLTRLENNLFSQTEFIRFDINGGGRYILVRNELEMREDPDGYVRTRINPTPDLRPARLVVIDDSLRELEDLDRWLRHNNIRVHYFIHPVNHRVLAAYSAESLFQLKSRIMKITGPIPDYTLDRRFTHNDYLYYDVNHYTSSVAKQILHEVLPASDNQHLMKSLDRRA